MNMNPAGIIAVAVGLLATALTGFAISAGTAESAAKELNDAIDQMHDSVESSIADNEAEMSVLKDKVKRYDELRTAVSLTSDEQKELSTLAQELQSVLGDEVTVVDQLTGKYNDLTDAVDTYVQKKTASVKLSAYEQEAAEAYNIKRNAENKLKELNEKYGGLNSDDYFAKIKATATVFSDYGNTLAAGQQFEADVKAAQKAIEEADKTIAEWQSLASESYKDGITASGSQTPAATSGKQAQPDNSLPDYWKKKSEDFKYWKESYKYDYDMGRISAEEYYATLASLRDEFLENDSDEWRSVNVEIKKYYDSLSEEQKKAYEKRLEEQKKAVRSGYDMDILPTDIVTYEKDTLEFLDDLNTSNQKMINMTFLITCYGRTKRELESLMQRVSGIIQQANCDLRCLQYLQEQGLMASAPIGCNETGIERTLSTKSTAILVPFCTQELFMPAPAIYYGLNALSNNMIMADRKRLRTPNGVILGTPGSGKSFSAKREILSCFLITKDDIIICDPEGEYFALVAALHGQVVKLATNSKDYLNPMDIQLSHKGDKEALKLKSDFIITLCDLIAGGKDGLENDEKGIIDECIRHIYDKYFENPVPENMPLLEDLYDALLAHKNPKAERIANSLVLYVHGSQNYFNHHTNVDSGNRIMCFDIRDLGNQLKELGMLIVQDAVWNRVSQNRERKIATRYYCDEFHLLLKEKQTAIYSVEIWKRFRKWGGIPTGLTQNVGDFLRSEEIEGILGNSDFVYLLNQNAKDQAILADKLGLSDKQLSYVTNSEPGSGLILFDNVVIPFVDKYPTDTKTYRIMNTKPEESVQKEDAV